MIKNLKKTVAVLVAAAMLMGLLSACQSKSDPIKEVMGYGKNTVMATFDGENVTAEDYFFWLARYVDYMRGMYSQMGTELNWEEDVLGDGSLTAKEYFKEESLETAKASWAILKVAKDEGFTYDKEDKDAYKEERKKAIENVGSQEEYDAYLNSMCLTEKSMEKTNEVNVLYKKMQEEFCGEGGRFEGSLEEIQSYVEEGGKLQAKHILLLKKDPAVDGEAYSDAKIAQQKAKAEDLLAQLRASEDPTALFDELMKENSEDSGLESNPDGYTFGPGEMVEAFENGTKALDYNEISDIVESEYGFHIILRLDPLADETVYEQYLGEWQGVQMDKMVEEKLSSLEVETKAAYDTLDVEDFYNKLTTYRETLEEKLKKEEESEEGTETEKDAVKEQPEEGSSQNPSEEDAAEGSASTGSEDPGEKAQGKEPSSSDASNGTENAAEAESSQNGEQATE